MMAEKFLSVITEADYEAAIGRVASGDYTDEGVNLIRAWWDRRNTEQAEMIRKIITALEGVPQGRA